eukprot:1140957-Pelagomonas_calceolata.AAC.4
MAIPHILNTAGTASHACLCTRTRSCTFKRMHRSRPPPISYTYLRGQTLHELCGPWHLHKLLETRQVLSSDILQPQQGQPQQLQSKQTQNKEQQDFSATASEQNKKRT